MTMKKMLYITPYDVSVPLSGAPARSREFVKFLSNYYDIHLVNIEGGAGHPPENMTAKRRIIYNNFLNRIFGKAEVKFSRFGYFIYSHSLFRAAQKMMMHTKFDIIIADYANASLYGYMLSKQFGVPWIYSSHNVEYRRWLELGKLDYRRYPFVPFMYLVERLGCSANLVVVISESDAKVFRRWVDEDKLVVILQGFNEETFNPYYEEPMSERPVVLFFGNLAHVPNREAAYTIIREILPRVVEKFPDVVFQFVGANPPKDFAHQNTQLKGFADNLADYIHRASVVIAPITLGGGMRTKIIEAIACGKVVISTDKGAEGILGNYRNLIIKKIEEFPDAICETIKNKKLVNDHEFETLKTEFSWNSTLPKLHQKIEEVINI